MKALVGYTGFVGSNLAASAEFDGLYNSKNILEAYGTQPDLLVYAGVPAAKYLANKAPEEDLAVIRQAEENIARIAPKKLVLISTIDVFPSPVGVDEMDEPAESDEAYGRNRRELEIWTREHYPEALIIRLPALFGKNLKKNFIYDMMHPIPFKLTEKLLTEFLGRESQLKDYYQPCDNGFFQIKEMDTDSKKVVKEIFGRLGFSAMNFTDSHSRYQFYPLSRLWDDISIALTNGIKILHLATEPVVAGELYKDLTGKQFINELGKKPANYDYKTVYGKLFGKDSAYLISKHSIIEDIREFISHSSKLEAG